METNSRQCSPTVEPGLRNGSAYGAAPGADFADGARVRDSQRSATDGGENFSRGLRGGDPLRVTDPRSAATSSTGLHSDFGGRVESEFQNRYERGRPRHGGAGSQPARAGTILTASHHRGPADWEVGDTAGSETCATKQGRRILEFESEVASQFLARHLAWGSTRARAYGGGRLRQPLGRAFAPGFPRAACSSRRTAPVAEQTRLEL
jgi:hypothetical protein